MPIRSGAGQTRGQGGAFAASRAPRTTAVPSTTPATVWPSTTTFVPPSGAEATREVTATYSREGSKLTMQWKGAGMTVGTISNNTFTMNNEGMLLVYRK